MRQEQVKEFHEAFGCTIGDGPKIRDAELRYELLREEVEEFKHAVHNDNLTEAIDALCDIVYVAFGAAVAFGVDLAPFFNEVHRSNMDKVGGHKREDGKWIKPANWQAPKIAELLKEQMK